jgi:hypothetical protein
MADPTVMFVAPGQLHVTGTTSGSHLETIQLEPGFAVIAITKTDTLLANIPPYTGFNDSLMTRLIGALLLMEAPLQPGDDCTLCVISPVNFYQQHIYPETINGLLYAFASQGVRIPLMRTTYTLPATGPVYWVVSIRTTNFLPGEDRTGYWPETMLSTRPYLSNQFVMDDMYSTCG